MGVLISYLIALVQTFLIVSKFQAVGPDYSLMDSANDARNPST